MIYDELCLGKIADNSRRQYLSIIAKLAERGARQSFWAAQKLLCSFSNSTPPYLFMTRRNCTAQRRAHSDCLRAKALLETFAVAFATFFATIGPFDVAAVFAGLTASVPSKRRRQWRCEASNCRWHLMLFALIGEVLLSGLGISLAALRTAGGVLLLMGIDMVFARNSGGTSTTDAEEEEPVPNRTSRSFHSPRL